MKGTIRGLFDSAEGMTDQRLSSLVFTEPTPPLPMGCVRSFHRIKSEFVKYDGLL